MVGLRVQEETEAGKDLGTALAVAAALTDSMLWIRCAACFGTLRSGGSMVYSCFGPCEGKVSYCCLACYNSDADLHAGSAECHLLMLISSSSCDLRAALRFLACSMGVDDRNRIQGSGRIGALLSNRSNILSDREAAAEVKEASHLMQLARRSAGLEWPYQDKEQEILILQHAFCIVVTNGVQIEVHEGSPPSRLMLGTGVYTRGFSWLNHSCRPNACYRFVMHSDDQLVEPCLDWPPPRHPRVVVRSIQAIQAGGEATISYTDLLKSKRARQAELQQKYKFNCGCERCRIFPCSYSDMILESIGKCGKGSCFGWLSLDTKACSWCSRVDSSRKDVLLEIKLAEARDKAVNAFLFDEDPGFCRQLLEKALCDVLVHSWPPTIMRSTCLDALSILKSAYNVLAATEGEDSSRYLGAVAGLSLMISSSVQHLYKMGEPGLVIVLGWLWLEAGEAFLRWNQTKINERDKTQKASLQLSVHMIQLVSSELELQVNKPPQAERCDPHSFADFCLQLSRHMLNLSLGELHPATQYVQSKIEQEHSYSP